MEDKLVIGLRWLLKEKLGLTKASLPYVELIPLSLGAFVFAAFTWLGTRDMLLTLAVGNLMLTFFGVFVILLFINSHDMRAP